MNEKPKILIVEDEETMCECLNGFVRKFGYEVSAVVSTGEDAVREARENTPDLILMDIVLRGDMNGIETAGQINSFCDVPVVYLTAFCDGEKLEEAKRTGPLGYIVKPFDPRELEIIIAAGVYGVEKERYFKDVEKQCCFCLKNFGGIVFQRDIDFIPKFIHGEVMGITGYNVDDFISRKLRWEDIVHPDDFKEYPGDIYEGLRKVPDFSDEREYRIICKDGEIRWIKGFVRNISDGFGKPICIQEIIGDITEMKDMEYRIEKESKDLKLLKTLWIDRENMMIKLKEKVNSLCKALGRTPEYDLSFLENGKNNECGK